MNEQLPSAEARTRPRRRIALACVASVALAAPVHAQGTQGGLASITVAAAAIEQGTSTALTAGIGYRFNSSVGLGIELTRIPRLEPDIPENEIYASTASSLNGYIVPVPTVRYEGGGGHATIFTANLRLELPRSLHRVLPYLVGGAGVGSVTDRLRVTIAYPPTRFITLSSSGALPPASANLPTLVVPPITNSIPRTLTGFAMTFGGGGSFLVGEHFSLDGDARYVGILGSRDLNIGRVGGGVSYRF
jgi:opacity protein-like surface antigen